MQIFNIGPVELILILLIMFILLGPEGMLKTARQIGTWIRQLVRSPVWRDIMGYSREIRELPTKIVRETGLDDDLEEIKKSTQQVTNELNQSVADANKEVQESLKEAGSVDVRISPTPPPASQPAYPATVPPPARQAATPAPTPGNGSSAGAASSAPSTTGEPPVKSEEAPSPLPPVQTYNKYSSSSDEDEEE